MKLIIFLTNYYSGFYYVAYWVLQDAIKFSIMFERHRSPIILKLKLR